MVKEINDRGGNMRRYKGLNIFTIVIIFVLVIVAYPFNTYAKNYTKGYNNQYKTVQIDPKVLSENNLSEVLEGIALKDPTNMYESPSTSSKALRSFNSGKVLKFYNYDSNWFWSYVTVDGKTVKIYINKTDVELVTLKPELREGIALKNPTNMYESPSTSSKVVRTFDSGKILKYYTFTSNWFKSYVTVNGKVTTIYIYKNDIEEPTSNPVIKEGIAIKNPTNMYESPTRNSKALRTFPSGKILKYYTYSSEWYRSSVLVNGESKTIYINKADVEEITNTPVKEEGIALKNPTNVYASASKSSKVLKTFNQGLILKYYTFTKNWYRSYTTVNGKQTEIFINVSDIEKANPSSDVLQGIAIKSPTYVYELPSINSTKLKTYNKGAILKFYDYSPNWYKSSVWVNGKGYVTCYIRKSDISTDSTKVFIDQKKYNYDFKTLIDKQVTVSPKVDGAGQFIASRALVEYYANPNNFDVNSKEYYQFLLLSQSANLDINEINQKILKGKGKLEGQASAFVDAGKLYGVNEIYLIAHVLHETGNGTSPLSQGVPVDDKGNVVDVKKAKYIVYNMYGYGAVDSNPLNGGAKYAFDQGWFSPREAIIGGAKLISSGYINQGQDTLYKMRWNPANPGTHQYATHVAWATAQTTNMYNIYQMLDSYVLFFEIPLYNNQPGKSSMPVGDAQYAVLPVANGLKGKTTTAVNFRTYPSTSTSTNIIQLLNGNTDLSIIGQNGGWYKVQFNGKTGWVSGDYISLENALQIKVNDALNVRSQPNTSSAVIGTLKNNDIVIAYVDNNNNYVKSGSWYKIQFNGKEGWVHQDYVVELKKR
jgi:mannosyl-glycoprotein endo-beta-N-acetylglucosaminidase